MKNENEAPKRVTRAAASASRASTQFTAPESK